MNKTKHACIKQDLNLVLTRGVSNLKLQTIEFDLISTCHKEIITNSQNIRTIINNEKYKTKGANLNAWKIDLTSSLNKYLNGNVILNSKLTIDLSISNLAKIINNTSQKSLELLKIVVFRSPGGKIN